MDNKKESVELSKKSNIFLENRKMVSITGVFEVVSFDDERVLLNTILKKLEVIGKNLKISKLDVKNGEVSILGDISGLKYLEDAKFKNNKSGVIKKILGKKLW